MKDQRATPPRRREGPSAFYGLVLSSVQTTFAIYGVFATRERSLFWVPGWTTFLLVVWLISFVALTRLFYRSK